MRIDGKSTRYHERVKLKIPVRVSYSEDAEKEWTENTLTEQITICGVSFTLSRPLELKRLVHLTLPMPKKFRLFDYGKEQYEVWGVVCDVRVIEPDVAGQMQIIVGTALIGEYPPGSFLHNPQTLYDLKPVLRSQSFWGVRELPRMTGPYRRSFEERQAITTELMLEIIDEKGRIIQSVAGETLNISESGMAIKTKFTTHSPRFVLIKNPAEQSTLLAAVRGIHQLDSTGLTRLHLEFVSSS